MSYLDIPRLHFSGRFQADISTVNNDVRYYDNAGFQDKYQTMSGGGAWNPEGTGIFRLVDCKITGARTAQGSISTPAEDPVIGMALENADDRVFGKLVDLDPQQQMVSQIWGMRLRLTDGKEPALFSGEFVPAPFTNLWLRQQSGVKMDQVLAALYQSVLHNVAWQDSVNSKLLDALRRASEDGYLAIDMNVYGYGRDPTIPRYTLGRVNGTIGPYHSSEPKHFVMGRQMVAALNPSDDVYPFAPTNGVYTFQAKVLDNKSVAADLGNALQIVDASGKLVPIGTLQLAVLKTTDPNTLQTIVTPSQVAILGTFDYQQTGWYDKTAGIQTSISRRTRGVSPTLRAARWRSFNQARTTLTTCWCRKPWAGFTSALTISSAGSRRTSPQPSSSMRRVTARRCRPRSHSAPMPA